MGLRQILKRAVIAPLRFAPLRSRVAFWLNQEHYRELGIQVPLSHGLVCPILSPEYWCSFSEIFVNAEYAAAFDLIPLPDRWIDLGCHAGFFSLYVQWRRRQQGRITPPEALLVDADRRAQRAVERVNAVNQLAFRFLHGGIGAPNRPMRFTERSFMASSATELDSTGGVVSLVPTVTEEMIARPMPGPYHLIKIDIEGSEHELLQHHGNLLRQCRHWLLEWHSWHAGGGGKGQLIERAKSLGCALRAELQPARDVGAGRECGVLLFENDAAGTREIAV